MVVEDPAEGDRAEPVRRRDVAVARSLDPARTRAEQRVQRFLDTALELLATNPSGDFTVQEVVEQSGQSLRSFYQHFAGKHELLLTLFEESVRASADELREVLAGETGPRARLQRFAREYYARCLPPGPGERPPAEGPSRPTPALAAFARQLLTDDPRGAILAFAPVVALLEELLDEAAAAGQIRAGLRHRQLAGVVLEAIMFNTYAVTISGAPLRPGSDDADELWALLADGIATG